MMPPGSSARACSTTTLTSGTSISLTPTTPSRRSVARSVESVVWASMCCWMSSAISPAAARARSTRRLVDADGVCHRTTLFRQAGSGTSPGSCPSGRRGETVDDVEQGDARADGVDERVEEDLGLIRLRHAERVRGERQHAQRAQHLERDAAAREQRHRRRRQDEHGRVADDDAQLATGRQDAGEVLDELPRQGAADEQRARAEALDLAGDRDAFADHRPSSSGVRRPARRPPRRAPTRAARASRDPGRGRYLRQGQHVEGRHGRLDHLVERVADHAAGGHDHAVRHARRGAADAVDRAVDEHLPGAVREQALDRDAQLGERRRSAHLDLAVARRRDR